MSDKTKEYILVIDKSRWGRGSTVAEARTKGRIKKGSPQIHYRITCAPDEDPPFVDEFGRVHWHGDKEEIFRSPSLRRQREK